MTFFASLKLLDQFSNRILNNSQACPTTSQNGKAYTRCASAQLCRTVYVGVCTSSCNEEASLAQMRHVELSTSVSDVIMAKFVSDVRAPGDNRDNSDNFMLPVLMYIFSYIYNFLNLLRLDKKNK